MRTCPRGQRQLGNEKSLANKNVLSKGSDSRSDVFVRMGSNPIVRTFLDFLHKPNEPIQNVFFVQLAFIHESLVVACYDGPRSLPSKTSPKLAVQAKLFVVLFGLF